MKLKLDCSLLNNQAMLKNKKLPYKKTLHEFEYVNEKSHEYRLKRVRIRTPKGWTFVIALFIIASIPIVGIVITSCFK
jgi:ABC-type Fe3+ transport system permease subunit